MDTMNNATSSDVGTTAGQTPQSQPVQTPAQMPQDQAELQEPKEKIKAGPIGLVTSFIVVGVIFGGGYSIYSKQSKESPRAAITQIQTEMQKSETEKNVTEETKLPESDIKPVVKEKIPEPEKIIEVDSKPVGTLVDEEKVVSEPVETAEAKPPESEDGTVIEEKDTELSENLGTSVMQPTKIKR